MPDVIIRKHGPKYRYRKRSDSVSMDAISVLNENCNCPAECPRHGNCVECVEYHKANSKKIPYCLRFMIEQ